MTIVWLLLSYIFLLVQGWLYFFAVMMAIPGSPATSAEYGLLWLIFLVGLPAVCAVAAVIVTVSVLRKWRYPYAWVLLPIPFAIAFPFLMFR